MKKPQFNKLIECPISGKLTYSYKEYAIEHYAQRLGKPTILNESPTDIGRKYPDLYDDISFNKEETYNIINTAKKIKDINIHNVQLSLYVDINKNIYNYYFIHDLNETINCYITIKVIDNYAELIGIWKSFEYKNIAGLLLILYILPYHSLIVSDKNLSTQGIKFWKKLMKQYFNTYEVGYMLKNAFYRINEINVIDDDQYWNNSNYQMYIKS